MRKSLNINLILLILSMVLVMFVIFPIFKKDNIEEEKKNAILIQSIENERIKNEIQNADKFIKELTFPISLNVVEEIGEYNINHDKTPKNNWWSEWLFNSELNVITNYKALITINTKDISLYNLNGIVYAEVRIKDFYVNNIELFDKAYMEDKKWFGSEYSKSDLIAIENQIIEGIRNTVLTEEVLSLGSENIEQYLKEMATLCNVPIIVTVK